MRKFELMLKELRSRPIKQTDWWGRSIPDDLWSKYFVGSGYEILNDTLDIDQREKYVISTVVIKMHGGLLGIRAVTQIFGEKKDYESCSHELEFFEMIKHSRTYKKKDRRKKQKDRAFRKDVYLLGADEEGILYWLEAPSWDCGWYWGFGYIETYTNNEHPGHSRDIESHQHAGSFMKWWTDINSNTPILVETTFNEAEGWEITELFKRFYMFQDLAEYYHHGHAGITSKTKPGNGKNLKEWDRINKKVIPEIMDRIIEILTP